MNITLFGYPRTGKTTLFNLLTGAGVEVKAYDAGKKEPNERTVEIPDTRLEKIWSLYPEKKKVAAHVDFTDLIGISFGEVKSSTYLSHLRNADGLVHVTRGFLNPEIPHPRGKVNPKEDISDMEEELRLADFVSVESRLEKLEKDLKKSKDAEGERERGILQNLHSLLEEGQGIREAALSLGDEKAVRSFAFLSQKPLLHMINMDEGDIPHIQDPGEFYALESGKYRVQAFCGSIESEILSLDEAEKEIFLKEYGLKELSARRFFRECGKSFEVVTFYTIGKEEVRAWMIARNTTAQNAAGVIHTDFEKGFIRAEVIPWDILCQHGSLQSAKDRGAARLEGRDYVVQDGDVIYFRFTS